MTTPTMNGLGHLDLTVTDGDRSVRWWEEVMGFNLLAKWEEPNYTGWTMAHPSGVCLTVITHDEAEVGSLTSAGSDSITLRFTWANSGPLNFGRRISTHMVFTTLEFRTFKGDVADH